MAQRAHAYADNAPGSFFVDQDCIDCGTCYTLAADVFADAGGHARVHRQPVDPGEGHRARLALVACPTASIGTDDRAGLREAAAAFPQTIEAEVSFCGYTSRRSFGAWSYLIERRGGNVLMDSPRLGEPLLRTLEARGGVRFLVLSHIDDVAEHEALRRRFSCERVMHRADGLAGLERYLDGEEPVPLAEDLLLIPTPGHTAGSTCLLYREAFLFTGDHLWWNPEKRRLSASRSLNWYSWKRQLASLEKLLSFDFRWVLPGHGASYQAESSAAMRRELERALVELRRP
jgi:glyoxylase-like metal-dependent hydrolase (beta-lactamase superfamily II)/ferredoxin